MKTFHFHKLKYLFQRNKCFHYPQSFTLIIDFNSLTSNQLIVTDLLQKKKEKNLEIQKTCSYSCSCSNLEIKTPEQRQWRYSCVFIIDFEYISQLFLVFLLLTLNQSILAGNFSHFNNCLEKKDLRAYLYSNNISSERPWNYSSVAVFTKPINYHNINLWDNTA